MNENKNKNQLEFIWAFSVTFLIIVLFFALQRLGLVDFIDPTSMTYGTALVIGLVASVSTCMAVIGGLVLSISATYSKGDDKIKPQVLFHLGRLVSFFILGGVIGSLGSIFTLSPTADSILKIIIAVIMLLLGLNLLNVFQRLKTCQITFPRTFSKFVTLVSSFSHKYTPFLIGVATFFLPCGFTQSMQIYTLSTGSFISGGLTMLAFALGTLPTLALISFGSSTINSKVNSVIFLKTAGLVIIFFALFNLYYALGGASYFNVQSKAESNNVSFINNEQIVELKAKGGYQPRKSVAQAGLPTIIRFETSGTFDCSSSVKIPSLNINKFLPQTGTTDINIGVPEIGLFKGSCGMGMYPFEIDFR
ncbi:MAG: sulfite exporter TauE/SafE family protein [Candidatus Paceibacterota bacterium]